MRHVPTPDTPPPDNPANTVRAAFWMIGSIASFSLMAISGRAVSFELDTFEIMMFRSCVGLFIVIIVAGATGAWRQITTRTPSLHLIRNVAHFSGQNLWFYAITAIPLAQVFALEFTSPLWVVVLSPLLLGERLTRIRVIVALVGFIGILLVARPTPETVSFGTLAAAMTAVFFATTNIFTKRLTRTETLTCILFWMTVTQLVFGLICAGYDGDIAMPSATTAPWLILIGCGGLLAHYCLTTALSLAPATVVMPVDFVRLPVIAVVGLMFYDEAVDIFVVLGALVIFGANYVNIWSETRRSPPKLPRFL